MWIYIFAAFLKNGTLKLLTTQIISPPQNGANKLIKTNMP